MELSKLPSRTEQLLFVTGIGILILNQIYDWKNNWFILLGIFLLEAGLAGMGYKAILPHIGIDEYYEPDRMNKINDFTGGYWSLAIFGIIVSIVIIGLFLFK